MTIHDKCVSVNQSLSLMGLGIELDALHKKGYT